ncbi:MAG TPA: DUF3006 domain-containing protein [Gemmatimonadetes bacterium]|jgi:hypothetical protein|nr:DUF3006 domain-containing protein [Gemmatimonadota bacterium]
MSDTERIWVVDRIEREAAVLVADENQEMLDIALDILPDGLREGSVLKVAEDMDGPLWASASLDEESKLERLREAEEVLDELRERDPGGDIVL